MSNTLPNTDVRNSDRFVALYGDTVKYIAEDRRWIAYFDGCWKPGAQVYKKAEAVAKSIQEEAKAQGDEQSRAALVKWAHHSESRGAIESMLKLASDKLIVSIESFDRGKETINCKNGLLNLRIKELTPHSPEQLVMKQAGVAYNPEAQCPRFKQFLREIFLDQGVIDWMQQALGYSLTGHIRDHCFFSCWGNGRNGKGTLLNDVMLTVLGDYAGIVDFKLLLSEDKGNVRAKEAVGKLRGKRFVLASEAPQNARYDEDLIKKITGGNRLEGARLRGDAFEFDPTHKLWVDTNKLPRIIDASYGMWERVKVISFPRKFEEHERNYNLKFELLAEAEGIFNWLVEGANKYLLAGRLPKLPDKLREETDNYRRENDSLGEFISECLESDPDSAIKRKSVWEKYLLWCQANDEHGIPEYSFTGALAERGIRNKKSKHGRMLLGVKLRDGEPIQLDITKPVQAEPVPPASVVPSHVSGNSRVKTGMQALLQGSHFANERV